MDNKQLLDCWKYYRGSNDNYLLSSSEAFELIKTTIFDRHLPIKERIIAAVYDQEFCRIHDC